MISFTPVLSVFVHIFNFTPLNSLIKFSKMDHNFRVNNGDESLQDL